LETLYLREIARCMSGTNRANGSRVFRAWLLLLAAIGCSKPEGPEVAFLLSTLQEERYQRDVKYFEARATELDLRVATLAAANDTATQLAQVEDVLARGVKILVIQPTDSQAAASYIERAHAKGAKVVAYDRVIVDAGLDYYVSHDSYRVGVLQAEAALRATGGKGNYVILSGQAGHSVAAEITRGYTDTLAPYVARGEVTVVVEQAHIAWSPEQAARTVEDALVRKNKNIDAILANNSGMARGAVQALGAAGLSNVFVAGADADAANVNLLCQGKQTIEVLKSIQPLAEKAAEVAKELLRGARPEAGVSMIPGTSVPVAGVRVELVTADTVKSRIVDTGILSVDDLPACKTKLAQVR
jgi:D-xylose transport system substrate-binding protein